MNQKSNELYKKRHYRNPEKKIKHVKIGVIIAFIFGISFIAVEAYRGISQNLINYQLQQDRLDFENGIITYLEYDNRRQELQLSMFEIELMASMASSTINISISIVFAFIIVSVLSISFDDSFDKKMRRLSLITGCIIFIFIMYLLFFSPFFLFSALLNF